MSLKEEQIRPKKLFDDYLQLAAEDAKTMLEHGTFEPCDCVVCGQRAPTKFSKLGFNYAECPQCLTIFCSPRPSVATLSHFYSEGRSTQFWATDFYRQTAEARREKLWRPKAQTVSEIFNTSSTPLSWICDIGGGYGIFAEEIKKLVPKSVEVTVMEPGAKLAEACRSRGLIVKRKFLEEATSSDFPPSPGLVTSFELFEHLHDPKAFVETIFNVLPKGSRVVLTTLSGAGLDIRLLGPQSKSIFPPHHLNFSNPSAMTRLFESIGFINVKTSTPGALDIDIVSQSDLPINCDFWNVFFKLSSDGDKKIMQEAVAASGFSSHMWVVAEKK